MRSKSGLAEVVIPAWDEVHKTGHGSATCFCRVMDRREKAKDARQALYEHAYGIATREDGPRFSDWICDSLGDLGRLYVEMEEGLRPGLTFRVRIQVLE
jgi:hypothetical protein